MTYVFVQPAKRNLFIKNGNKGTDYSATYESVAVPVDRDKEIRTALSTHQIAGFVTVPTEKKIHLILNSCKVIFPSPEEARKNTSNEQNFCSHYMLNHRIRDFLFHYYFQFLVF